MVDAQVVDLAALTVFHIGLLLLWVGWRLSQRALVAEA